MSWRSGQAGCNIGKKPLYTGPSSGGFCSFSFCRQLRTGLCQVSCRLRAGPPPTAALLYDLRLSKRNVRRSQGEEAAVVAGGRGNRIRWCPGRRPISFSFFCGQVLPAVTNDFLFHLYDLGFEHLFRLSAERLACWPPKKKSGSKPAACEPQEIVKEIGSLTVISSTII